MEALLFRTSTASSAALSAILAAREKKTNYETNDSGSLGNLVAYVSIHTHSSVEEAIKIAGIGKNNLRLIGGLMPACR